MITTRLIKDTEIAKQVWEILHQVQTQAVRFEVMQGSNRVASIVPVAPSRKTTTLAELDQLFATLPRLGADEVEAFEQDIKMAMNQLTGTTELWE